MTQKYWEQEPTSFADTVKLTKNYVKAEVTTEADCKQLYYHNLDHALAVERRAIHIFRAVKPVLLKDNSPQQLARMENLISVCGLAHDMVQVFEPTPPNKSRKRYSGSSETETAEKLIQYINRLNQALAAAKLDSSLQYSEDEQEIIRDSIVATVCIPDPKGTISKPTFSQQSIYQPYLYMVPQETSIVGRIIALADLGALGIDGVETYIRDGILIFLEDNPHFINLILNPDRSKEIGNRGFNEVNARPVFLGRGTVDHLQKDELKAKLLNMTRFMIDFARERLARFEREIADFSPQMRHILGDRVFIYLNQKSINQIKNTVPSHSDVSFSELRDFLIRAK